MAGLDALDFVRAIGLALIIEGALYALFPDTMRRLIAQALEAPRDALRIGALLTATAGLAVLVLSGS